MRHLLPLAALILLVGCFAEQRPAAQSPAIAAEQTVSYAAGKEVIQGSLQHPLGDGPFPALVMVHGDFGLTAWVKEQARREAERGFVVLAVDLYRGKVIADLMDAHIMDRGLPDHQVLGDLKA